MSTPDGDFIQRPRTRYGSDTAIAAVGAGQYDCHVQQVVKARNDAGDNRVRHWALDDSGLDFPRLRLALRGPRRPPHRRPAQVVRRRSADRLVTAPAA
ncbi:MULTISPECIES: hypothetical protein [Streptomyces]|uniref:hypothetical protein n=1 Tax=Streptomyces TaxID=1883 RepID=UPI002E2714A4|nr:hypothetical protein OG806_45205 [Streptomyces sp. NBC_00882]